MHQKKQLDSVNDARLEIFLKKYKSNTKGNVVSCVKKMISRSLTPCSRVVEKKIKRTNCIYSIWNIAAREKSPNFQPKNCGWIPKNDTFKIKWFEGEMSPSTVKMIRPERCYK